MSVIEGSKCIISLRASPPERVGAEFPALHAASLYDAAMLVRTFRNAWRL